MAATQVVPQKQHRDAAKVEAVGGVGGEATHSNSNLSGAGGGSPHQQHLLTYYDQYIPFAQEIKENCLGRSSVSVPAAAIHQEEDTTQSVGEGKIKQRSSQGQPADHHTSTPSVAVVSYVLVMELFSAWCGPCLALNSAIQQMAMDVPQDEEGEVSSQLLPVKFARVEPTLVLQDMRSIPPVVDTFGSQASPQQKKISSEKQSATDDEEGEVPQGQKSAISPRGEKKGGTKKMKLLRFATQMWTHQSTSTKTKKKEKKMECEEEEEAGRHHAWSSGQQSLVAFLQHFQAEKEAKKEEGDEVEVEEVEDEGEIVEPRKTREEERGVRSKSFHNDTAVVIEGRGKGEKWEVEGKQRSSSRRELADEEQQKMPNEEEDSNDRYVENKKENSCEEQEQFKKKTKRPNSKIRSEEGKSNHHDSSSDFRVLSNPVFQTFVDKLLGPWEAVINPVFLILRQGALVSILEGLDQLPLLESTVKHYRNPKIVIQADKIYVRMTQREASYYAFLIQTAWRRRLQLHRIGRYIDGKFYTHAELSAEKEKEMQIKKHEDALKRMREAAEIVQKYWRRFLAQKYYREKYKILQQKSKMNIGRKRMLRESIYSVSRLPPTADRKLRALMKKTKKKLLTADERQLIGKKIRA